MADPVLGYSSLDLRQHQRFRAQFRTRFTTDQGVIVGEGTVRDFSPGGCRIRSFTPPPPGSDVELCIYPDDTSGGLAIQLATVCWVRDYERQKGAGLAIRHSRR